MKKLVSTLTLSLAIGLLAGCSEKEEVEKPKEEAIGTELTAEELEQIENLEQEQPAENNTEKPKVAPEKAQEALTKIVENAKADKQLKDAVVEETETDVKATLDVEEGISKEDLGMLILNYQIMLQAAHPDKAIDIEIKE